MAKKSYAVRQLEGCGFRATLNDDLSITIIDLESGDECLTLTDPGQFYLHRTFSEKRVEKGRYGAKIFYTTPQGQVVSAVSQYGRFIAWDKEGK